jgi:hypothetical protein
MRHQINDHLPLTAMGLAAAERPAAERMAAIGKNLLDVDLSD